MYPWTDATINFLAGKCEHNCKYCYMKQGVQKLLKKYQGEPRLVGIEMDCDLYKCENMSPPFVIFVGSGNDVFARNVPDNLIGKILTKCNKYPNNTYLFQSKNPLRFADFWFHFPKKTILGTTIETNRVYDETISKAPSVMQRAEAMENIKASGEFQVMVNIEPAMDFDVRPFFNMLRNINADFVSIGADSKDCDLPEPSMDKIETLIAWLETKTQVKIKDNLNRLL